MSSPPESSTIAGSVGGATAGAASSVAAGGVVSVAGVSGCFD